jgi:SAM-dependent methyltransferase
MTALRSRIHSQFGHPAGVLGGLAGVVMASRSGNRQRNAWTVRQLDIQPTDRVLEIGFGPGLAIRDVAERATAGSVVGVDHSEVMRRQAGRRNRGSVAAGRVTLVSGGVADLIGAYPGTFDKAFAVNVFMFWSDPAAILRQAGRLLAPGARIALTMQPRGRAVTDDDSDRAGERMAEALRAAGYADVDIRILPLEPASAACALATWPRSTT